MSDRYHVQVRVRTGMGESEWRRVHPVGGDPYVFTRAEAEIYIKAQCGAHGTGHVGMYRLEELPFLDKEESTQP